MFETHVIRQLSAYHHGEMTAAEKLCVETHLRTCAKCRVAHDEIRFGARLASTLSVSNAPASIWSELHQLPHASTRRRWSPQLVVVGALAAAALLAVFVTRNQVSPGP